MCQMCGRGPSTRSITCGLRGPLAGSWIWRAEKLGFEPALHYEMWGSHRPSLRTAPQHPPPDAFSSTAVVLVAIWLREGCNWGAQLILWPGAHQSEGQKNVKVWTCLLKNSPLCVREEAESLKFVDLFICRSVGRREWAEPGLGHQAHVGLNPNSVA